MIASWICNIVSASSVENDACTLGGAAAMAAMEAEVGDMGEPPPTATTTGATIGTLVGFLVP